MIETCSLWALWNFLTRCFGLQQTKHMLSWTLLTALPLTFRRGFTIAIKPTFFGSCVIMNLCQLSLFRETEKIYIYIFKPGAKRVLKLKSMQTISGLSLGLLSASQVQLKPLWMWMGKMYVLEPYFVTMETCLFQRSEVCRRV